MNIPLRSLLVLPVDAPHQEIITKRKIPIFCFVISTRYSPCARRAANALIIVPVPPPSPVTLPRLVSFLETLNRRQDDLKGDLYSKAIRAAGRGRSCAARGRRCLRVCYRFRIGSKLEKE
ncbi:hypothetical protein EVAR_76048_1 [Eumeta japonica]|uniref:Uncharacterized protein n=1 Tax=Eumeta variegata TaxID=151549 RepID=A0A4C1UAD0_EUMVA|nr:hypothetical protein EVAR_76048_1 [Eumeta japonica]